MNKTTTWYQTWASFGEIKEIEVERVTNASIWVGGDRQSRTGYRAAFPTRAEAVRHVRDELSGDIERAEKRLAHAYKQLVKFARSEA